MYPPPNYWLLVDHMEERHRIAAGHRRARAARLVARAQRRSGRARRRFLWR